MANFQSTILQGDYRSSFGGTDIQAVIGTSVIGTLQAISYSVTREKGPVYTMSGQPDPVSFARGKRAIAGTLVFITINEQALLSHMKNFANDQFYSSKRAIRYGYGNEITQDNLFALFEDNGLYNVNYAQLTGNSGPGYERAWAGAWYADQILPFDVNLSAVNEYGQAMKKSFIGVEILNEGGGVSIDDLVLEESYTYIARGMTPWVKITLPHQGKPTSGKTA